MKKTKLIALALAAGITFMGAGYAAWTDNFTATNIVETGKLEVSFVKANDYADIYLTNSENSPNADEVLANHWDRITEDSDFFNITLNTDTTKDKAVTFSFNNLFPGVTATSYFKLQNSGTVPAAIQNVTVIITDKDGNVIDQNNPNRQLYDALQVYNRFFIKKDGVEVKKLEAGWVSLGELQAKLTDMLKGEVIQGGAELGTMGEDGVKRTWFNIPANSLEGNEGEGQNIKIQVKFDFVQSNLYDENK